MLKKDCRHPTYHAKLYRRPCFSIKIPIDTKKQRCYTPNRQKQCLINLSCVRPILMTTGAMVLGAVPLALASGAGAESRQQIGWVIVGGLLLGTFFTLFVVPTVYSLLASRVSPVAEDAGAVAQVE